MKRSARTVLFDSIPGALAVPLVLAAAFAVLLSWPNPCDPFCQGDDLRGSAFWAAMFGLVGVLDIAPIILSLLGRRREAWLSLGIVTILTLGAVVL